MAQKDDREELLRLKEENLRLREERLSAQRRLKAKEEPTTINVKQVNESCLSGCAGMFAVVIIGGMLLSQCSH